MKTFEFLISEVFATSFDIEAETEEKAIEKLKQSGYDVKNIRRERIDWQIETIEDEDGLNE